MLITISSLLILATCFGSSVSLKNKSGYTIRLTLSDYSNPYQVLAETGEPCDPGVSGICDPFFEVKFGSHPNTFYWANESRVFQNAANLTGDFFTAEFQVEQEVTDSLHVAITVRDYSPMDHEDRIIARPIVELAHMLPSIPGHRNAVKRQLSWTPENRHVRFTLTAEINCWPNQYGRRCSTVCHGNPVYPSWEAGDPAKSVEIIGCRTSDANNSGIDAASPKNEASHALTKVKSDYFIVTVTLAGVGALALIIFSVVCINRRRMAAKRQRRIYEIRRLSQQNSVSTAAGHSSYDASISVSYRLDGFKNPVYTPLALQQLQQQQQHQQSASQQTQQRQVARGGANSTTHDSSIEEVYEEVEEPQVPALPPRRSVDAAAR